MFFNLINILSQLCQSYFNMNGNVYGYSNPNYFESTKFSTQFYEINKSTEFFEVYSHPITSRYADVYWTMMPPVNLPDNIVNRFNGKTIAIVGYEVDQVFKYDNGSESSVPITWAYNHHYEAYLRNQDSSFYKVDDNINYQYDYGQYNHGARSIYRLLNSSLFNNNALYFSEANGGEFRASFHGYPNGYAQLLRSPKYFDLQPMQIDTRNRDPKYINSPVFVPGIMPKNSAAPPNAAYSGLLECPCTTRIHKTIKYNYNYLIDGTCKDTIVNTTECGLLSNSRHNSTIVRNHTLPYGCIYNLNNNEVNSFVNIYNNNINCGSKDGKYKGFSNDSLTNLLVYLNHEDNTVNMTLIGPSRVWYGVAFGATQMSDEPYSIIVNGSGGVFEQKLGNHGPGRKLQTTLKVLSDTIVNDIRKVVLTRSSKGINSDYYDFSNVDTNINILLAVGSGPSFAYHKLKSTNQIQISSLTGYTCICNDGKIGKINGIRFQKHCMPEPRGDLIQQHNPTCFIETYQGGQSCCHHKWVLLDEDQQQPEHEMTYHLKYRFYFQNYTTQKEMVRAYYQTEAYSGEYDVPKCLPGTPPEECIHSITAHWQASDMVDHRYIGKSKGFELIYAAPHCHAPMCIDVELYNADTGNLLCRVEGLLGTGNSSKPYDEVDYIKLNPCLWGYDKGLLKPEFLHWNTNLTSIKRCNSTNLHYGEMASWQMRGVVIN